MDVVIGEKTHFPITISYPERSIYNVHPVAFYEALLLWTGFLFLIVFKGKIKDSTRISIAILFYTIIRMCILEGLYSYNNWFGTPLMRIIYCIIIISCVSIIIKNKLKGDTKDGKKKK